jgi:hypothetical protein
MTVPGKGNRPNRLRTIPPLMVAAWEGATSESDPLAAFGATRALVGLLSTWESQLVSEAIEAGATWEVVGGTVGSSRQAAWERFHHDVDDFRSQVRTDARALQARHRQETREFKERVKSRATARRRK